MKYFDTHIHLNIEPLKQQFSELINEYEKNDIFVNIIGTCIEDSLIAVEQANQSKNAYCTIGIHPTECYSLNLSETMDQLRKIYNTKPNKIIAIGECGLDYHYPDTNIKIQTEFFKAQIELSIELNLPLVLHIRDAHDDAISILSQYNLKNVIIHCYTDNLGYAQAYVALGYYISFPGVITFKKLDWLREIISKININYILSETDAPWLSPEPNRGKINHASNLIYINQCIAKQLNLSLDKTNKILFGNAINVLKL